ncbi:hypothetical protein KR009_005363 [Drosophila setifemur]|nr:hypothetical protein KR009_005363 [Drosophila setifemur]
MDLNNLILRTNTGKQLSEYQFNLLSKNSIGTRFEFFEADDKKLHELLAINVESVRELKKELALLPKQYAEETLPDLDYGTGMEELDKLLDSVQQPFKPGRVWEVCGETGVGKTQLMYTLTLNFVWKHDLHALFIDIKRDFSCKRIQEMLIERKMNAETCERTMKAIRVVEAPAAKDLMDLLQSFDQQLTEKVEDARQTKLVVIDSLPACFVHFRGKEMSMQRRSLLVELACRIRKLAIRGVAFIIGNVSFSEKDKDNFNDDGEVDGNSDEKSVLRPTEPMLGSYWSSVCTLRISLELPVVADGNEESYDHLGDADVGDDCLRLASIVTNTYGPVGDFCLLRISDVGVV